MSSLCITVIRLKGFLKLSHINWFYQGLDHKKNLLKTTNRYL